MDKERIEPKTITASGWAIAGFTVTLIVVIGVMWVTLIQTVLENCG